MTWPRRSKQECNWSTSSPSLANFYEVPSVHNLGSTRSSRKPDHLLLTPDTFIRAPLPGMKNATAIVHVSPAKGAKFTQYTAELEAGGELGPTPCQRFLFVIE